ncbi:MAG: hypothetical protein AABZ39_17055 [Spirochaetota bacterium]
MNIKKWLPLALFAVIVILFFVVPMARRKTVDVQTRHIATLFRDDEFASQYTFVTGAFGLSDREKAVLRLGYFMNYAAFFPLSKNDSHALISILSENLTAAGCASMAKEPGAMLKSKRPGMSNDYTVLFSRFEVKLLAALATNREQYRLGDALWHLSYAVQLREMMPEGYRAVLETSTNAGIRDIVSAYRGLATGTNTRSAVKTLIRGYVAE